MTEWRPVAAPPRPPPPPGEVPVTTHTFRPSLLAALDVPIKILVFVFIFFLPLGIGGAAATGDPLVAILGPAFVTALNFFPALFALLAPAVQIMFTRYVIDDDGIRVTVQFLSKNESRVNWPKVTAITHKRTVVDRIFGIERLDIVAYGERGTTLRLVGLRDAPQLRDLAAKKMREHATVEALFSND